MRSLPHALRKRFSPSRTTTMTSISMLLIPVSTKWKGSPYQDFSHFLKSLWWECGRCSIDGDIRVVVANSSCPPIFLMELFPLQYTMRFIKNKSLKPFLVLKQLDKSFIEEKLWGNDNNKYSVCWESLIGIFCMLLLCLTARYVSFTVSSLWRPSCFCICFPSMLSGVVITVRLCSSKNKGP